MLRFKQKSWIKTGCVTIAYDAGNGHGVDVLCIYFMVSISQVNALEQKLKIKEEEMSTNVAEMSKLKKDLEE